MSRELRRVPLGFDWPISKVWQGYLLPENLRSDSCTSCAGTGTTSARQWVDQITHLLLMLDDDLRAQSLGRPMHPYFHDTGSRAYGGRPSADITEFGTGLAGRPGSFMGHDAIDGWIGGSPVSEAAARAFVGAEWAPSMVATPETGLLGGVEWLGATAGESA
jgi:hypothetical protein